MQSNKLRMAIRATAAVAVFGTVGMVGQVQAIELSTGDYTTNIYGFARLAATYDIDENIASGGQSGNFASISTGGGDTIDGHFGADANTSRLGFSVTSPQDVKVVVELDFDGSDGLDPRLRHAYGQYKNVIIGRYWSNYTSFVGNTSTLDFDSLPGTAGTQGRTEQLRYTSGPMSFSVEQPSTDIIGTLPQKDSTPAFTARFEDSQGGLSYSAAVMAKQNSVDDGTNDDSGIGYATFLAGKVAISDMISIQGAVNYADGAVGYIFRTGENFAGTDAYQKGGDLESISAFGGSLGVSVNLEGGRSVNLGYGMASQDIDDAVSDGALPGSTAETNSMITLNYQWVPVKNVKMGVEYARLETENQDGSDGDANRVMFLAQYSF